jgi:hypothetical protein
MLLEYIATSFDPGGRTLNSIIVVPPSSLTSSFCPAAARTR